MTRDYSPLLSTAARLIAYNGREVTLYAPAVAEAVTGEPWRGPTLPVALGTTPAPLVTRAVFVGLLKRLGDEFLKDLEQVAMVAGSATDVAPYKLLVDSGSRWVIHKVETIKPGPIEIVHFLGLKR